MDHLQCISGFQYCVDQCIQANARLDKQEQEKGHTPLTLAANQGHVKVMKMLIEAHCDVTLHMFDGRSALWFMAQQGHADMVSILGWLLLMGRGTTKCNNVDTN